MLRENALVPYKSGELPSGKTLVFSPHPDDELFGCGGTILKLVSKNQVVEVALVTNGDLAGNATTRLDEFKRVTQEMGVQKAYYLNLPDGSVKNDIQTLSEFIKIIQESKPDNVFFPSPLEYHIDHRTTAYLVWAALQQQNFSGKAYSYEIGNQSPTNTLIDITGVMNKKIELMHRYESQLQFNSYPEKITSINRSRSYTLPASVEYAEAFFCFEKIYEPMMLALNRQNSLFVQDAEIIGTPWVSVMIRTKDRHEQLKSALNSVIQQTYPFIELVCVNDGGIKIDNLVNTYPFQKCVIQNNETSKGRAGAANDLLKLATGEYLIFLDDDDTFDQDHVENLINILVKNPNVKAAYSGVRIGNGLPIMPKEYNQPYNAALLRRGNYIPIHAVLFSKKLVENGCRFDESFEIYEDWDFWIQISQHTAYYHHNKVTATYNIHGNSGAGESANKIDEQIWVVKIYEKWQPNWTGRQISQTYQAIHHNASKSPVSSPRDLQGISYDNKLEARITELEQSLNQEKANLKQQRDWSQFVITSYLRALDTNNAADRNFQLKPSAFYMQGCCDLFEQVFGQKMPMEFWRWKYDGVHWRNICAVDKDDKVIGFYGGMKRDIIAFGKLEMALQPSDTMVLKKARGGLRNNSVYYVLFKTYSNLNACVNSDARIGYGFPNKRTFDLASALGFYEQVDTISEIQWDLCQDFADENLKVVAFEGLDNNLINQLWLEMRNDFVQSIIGVRDFDYLQHRYVKHPVHSYNILSIVDINGVLIGVVVIKKENDHVKIMDIISSMASMEKVLIKACFELKKDGFKKVNAWVTTSHKDFLLTKNASFKEIDVVIPLHKPSHYYTVDEIKNKWFLMYGDTDFI